MDSRQPRPAAPPQQPSSSNSPKPSHFQPRQGSSAGAAPQQQLQQQQQEPRGPVARGSFGRKPATIVHFCLQYHTDYGQRIRLVGSHDSLGAWQLRDGMDLRWSEGDNWVGDVELPGGAVYEYKYVLLDAASGHALSWQRGNNSVLALKAGEDHVEVYDNWEGQPGAAVVAAGASVTRERRLLDWATEMEALVTTQRNDLRRARMELVAATEDAQQSRAELRAARAELARTRALQATERRKAAELAAQNQALSRHLVETTASFREALQLVETLLGDDATSADDDSDSDDGSVASAADSGRGSGGRSDVDAASSTIVAAANGTNRSSSGMRGPGAGSSAVPQAEQMQFLG